MHLDEFWIQRCLRVAYRLRMGPSNPAHPDPSAPTPGLPLHLPEKKHKSLILKDVPYQTHPSVPKDSRTSSPTKN